MPWTESGDFLFALVPAAWTERGEYWTALVVRIPPRARLLVEFFGTSQPLVENIPSDFDADRRWGLLSQGLHLANYGNIPANISIGTTSVPILTARTVVRGDLTLFASEQVTDNVEVRIRGRYEADPRFEDPRPPPSSRLDRALSAFGLGGLL